MNTQELLDTYFKQADDVYSQKPGTYQYWTFDNGETFVLVVCHCGLAFWNDWSEAAEHLTEAHITECLLGIETIPK